MYCQLLSNLKLEPKNEKIYMSKTVLSLRILLKAIFLAKS